MNQVVRDDVKTIIKSIRKEAKSLEGKTVLITGGSGFLGSYFLWTIHELNNSYLKKPCKVITVDNYITGNKTSILKGLKSKSFMFLKRDVCRPLQTKQRIDYIIHAAGIASPVYYTKFPLETIKVATWGTQNLLELAMAKKVKSFLFFSSSEIYGDPHPEYIPTPETYKGYVSSVGSRACYDESKRLGETLSMVYFNLYNLPVKIVRPFNVFGPGMNPNDNRVMPRFLTNALRGEALPIFGSGLQTRTYCYITDAVAGFFKVLLSKGGGEVYNIGNSNNEINLPTLASLVTEVFSNKIKIEKIPYPPGYPSDEPNRRCPDITKARTKLNYKPQVNVKKGIVRLLRWYKDELGL